MINLTKDSTGKKVCIVPENIAYIEEATSIDHGEITRIIFCALTSTDKSVKNLALIVRESLDEVRGEIEHYKSFQN